jgi:hypothetical protein
VAERVWDVRHSRTNVLVGKITLDIPKDVLDPRYSPRSYYLPVTVPVEIGPMPDGLGTYMQATETSFRMAIINTRVSLGTLWVETASELYGVPGYAPWW